MTDKKDPFSRAAKEKKATSTSLEKINPPTEIKFSVDEYKKLDGQIKVLEGEKAGHKSILEAFARDTYATRQVAEKSGNFAILGDSSHVTYIVQDASGGMTQVEYDEFASQHGKKAAESLLALNKASVKFDVKTLEEPGVMQQVVDALNTLPPDLLERLFTPAYYGVVEDVTIKARKFAKDAKQYQQIMSDLKVKAYIRG